MPFSQGFDNSSEVDLESRNLVELPAGARHGSLFVVPHPKAGEDYGRQLNVLSAKQAKELAATSRKARL